VWDNGRGSRSVGAIGKAAQWERRMCVQSGAVSGVVYDHKRSSNSSSLDESST